MGSLEKTIRVGGMHCRSCEVLLTDVLREIKGIKGASADIKSGTVTLTAADKGAIEEAKKAIAKEGYKVVG